MKKLFLLIAIFFTLPISAAEPPLYGKVKVVDNFADYKVKIVTSFPDLKVKKVDNFADSPGLWQFVKDFPDFTIQIVSDFPDFTIQFVDAFPGVPNDSKLSIESTQSSYCPYSLFALNMQPCFPYTVKDYRD